MELEAWMKHNKISDDDLSGAVGISRAYVSRIRRGMVHPNLGVALDIWYASGFAVEIESMLPAYLRSGARQRRDATDAALEQGNFQTPAAPTASKSPAAA